MPKGRGIRAAQAKATRQILIDAARVLFAQKGFHATATQEIVEVAGVTRGALQHHFPRKEDLFRAVFEQAGRDVVQETADRVATEGWTGLVADLMNFVGNIRGHDIERITFLDGPAVLGWTEWRRLQINNGLSMMETAIADGIATGVIASQPPRALAHLILSVVEEAALMALNADQMDMTPHDVEFAMLSLLHSLDPGRDRTGPGGHAIAEKQRAPI